MCTVTLVLRSTTIQTAIEMSPNDLVAELRAEINHWWETMHNKNNAQQHSDKCDTSSGKGGSANPGIVYGGVRLITQGQELSPQVDDKTLAEMQFKDHQVSLSFLCLYGMFGICHFVGNLEFLLEN